VLLPRLIAFLFIFFASWFRSTSLVLDHAYYTLLFHTIFGKSYIITWQKSVKATSEDQQPDDNVKVWHTATGECVLGLYVKAFSRAAWPHVRFSSREQYALALSTNEIKIYNLGAKGTINATNGFDRFIKKLRVPDISAFSVAPTPPDMSEEIAATFHTFVPEKKGKPAKVAIYRYPDAMEAEASPLISKSCFQAEEVSIKWSPRGDAALVLTHTTVDTTGSSYYGSTQLHLLSLATGNKEATTVPLAKEGPVHAVEWCPYNPSQAKQPPTFCVISGKMPALGALYNGQTCQPTFLLGESHKNTISWSPSGRFVNVSGFGNLAGRMEFWDRNKCKPIPQVHLSKALMEQGGDATVTFGNTSQSAGCSYGWSPDSRLFQVSTTSPRMNVDNGVRLYRYNGLGPICDYTEHLLPDQLLAAEFIPPRSSTTGTITYPDRPQSPVPKGIKLKPVGTDPVSGGGATAATIKKPAAQAYVPPLARGRGIGGVVGASGASRGVGGGGSLAQRMRREKESQTVGAKKVTSSGAYKPPGASEKSASSGGGGRVIPGMAPPPAAADGNKRALKKEKAKLKKAKEQEEEQLKQQALAEEEEQRKAAAAQAQEAPLDPEKRLRKIKKVLKQIDGLKSKPATEWDGDQRKKMATEASLIDEMKELELEISNK
jgi:translation initiation factor 2A